MKEHVKLTKRNELDAANRGDGPLGRAGDDEPVFIVRAHDALAVEVVGCWLDAARRVGVDARKIHGIERLLTDMHVWRGDNGTKVPD